MICHSLLYETTPTFPPGFAAPAPDLLRRPALGGPLAGPPAWPRLAPALLDGARRRAPDARRRRPGRLVLLGAHLPRRRHPQPPCAHSAPGRIRPVSPLAQSAHAGRMAVRRRIGLPAALP